MLSDSYTNNSLSCTNNSLKTLRRQSISQRSTTRWSGCYSHFQWKYTQILLCMIAVRCLMTEGRPLCIHRVSICTPILPEGLVETIPSRNQESWPCTSHSIHTVLEWSQAATQTIAWKYYANKAHHEGPTHGGADRSNTRWQMSVAS